MMKEEEIQQTLIYSDFFRNETIEDQKLFLLLDAQQLILSLRTRWWRAFYLCVTWCVLGKITLIVGSVLTDPEYEFSSDEYVENNKVFNINYKSDKDNQPTLFQEMVLDEEVDALA